MNNEARGGLAVSGGTIDVHKPFSVGVTVTPEASPLRVTVTPDEPESVAEPVTVTPKPVKQRHSYAKPVTVTPVSRMKRLRAERRARGLVEVSVWVPVDKVDAIRLAAEEMSEGVS